MDNNTEHGTGRTPSINPKVFHLLQLKYATLLESKGMKHSSGRSARVLACRELNLNPREKHNVVIDRINQELRKYETL